jgi:hypothetical protein
MDTSSWSVIPAYINQKKAALFSTKKAHLNRPQHWTAFSHERVLIWSFVFGFGFAFVFAFACSV